MKKSANVIRRVVVIFVLAFIAATPAISQNKPKDLKPTVILVSIDGFRYDYFEKFQPPELNKIAREGVRAKWMTPAFPTKTFPNHYTIATGLYPEHHGIIENNIWDFGVTFSLGKREEVQNSRWWLGEPIWVTAEKQGLRAGAFFFPGTEAEIAGRRPTFWKSYEGKIPNNERVDQILSWIDLPPAERPRIYTLYFSDVDDAGHDYSPDSEETKKAVLTVDENIRRLMDGLRARQIDKNVNVIIVSDHGMAPVDQRNAVIMDEYLDSGKTERVLTTGEIWQIFPKAGMEDEIMGKLKFVQHAVCWRKSEIPERLHYRDSLRIAPIVCSAEEGWFMISRSRNETQKKRADFGRMKGAHGYDNKYESMRAIFVGHGHAFKKKKIAEAFPNVDVYELMCKILRLTPAKNDGDLKRVREMLK